METGAPSVLAVRPPADHPMGGDVRARLRLAGAVLPLAMSSGDFGLG